MLAAVSQIVVKNLAPIFSDLDLWAPTILNRIKSEPAP